MAHRDRCFHQGEVPPPLQKVAGTVLGNLTRVPQSSVGALIASGSSVGALTASGSSVGALTASGSSTRPKPDRLPTESRSPPTANRSPSRRQPDCRATTQAFAVDRPRARPHPHKILGHGGYLSYMDR